MGIVLFTFLFGLAVSVDSFGIGCMIGLKKIGISKKGICAIACLSGCCYLLSAYLGEWIKPFIDQAYAERFGALGLIAIGLFFLFHCLRKPEKPTQEDNVWAQPTKVLQSPEAADLDRSGQIKGRELLLLSLALSLDTFAAGISGSFIGIDPNLTACLILIMTTFMLLAGVRSGEKLSKKINNISILPGMLLIIIGLIKLV
ncbi:sporulation membrane protein YtaF [Halobacillus naozhouensis]|uniref:Sporulation membrane protein YtaF n=1 Tax=Halobacillus naozhouensis TaxID=554880 RepID=A0ABY8IUW4_9BACI|nr:sporulation membrane protein YtaF [Halobacillus naozhouensis]WFT73471.1 sporulation membrane protein YtaF [Halobacillus naozhouensis]